MEFNSSLVPDPKNVRAVDLVYLFRNFYGAFGLATASTAGAGVMRGLYAGNWSTLRTAKDMASWAIRSHWNMGKAVINTPLTTRAGSRTLGQAVKMGTSSLVAAYTLGAVAGIAVADIFFDEKELAAELYLPGGTSFWDEFWGMPRNVETILNHYLA